MGTTLAVRNEIHITKHISINSVYTHIQLAYFNIKLSSSKKKARQLTKALLCVLRKPKTSA
jgi:hypothetical protein